MGSHQGCIRKVSSYRVEALTSEVSESMFRTALSDACHCGYAYSIPRLAPREPSNRKPTKTTTLFQILLAAATLSGSSFFVRLLEIRHRKRRKTQRLRDKQLANGNNETDPNVKISKSCNYV